VVLHKLRVLFAGVFLARLDRRGFAFVGEHLEDVLFPDDGSNVHHVRQDVPGQVEEGDDGQRGAFFDTRGLVWSILLVADVVALPHGVGDDTGMGAHERRGAALRFAEADCRRFTVVVTQNVGVG
jgi:hypothetical protein